MSETDDNPRLNAPAADWRGPAFWMACGALLAVLAGAGVMLAQRVSAERDLAALARLVPPPAQAVPAAPAAPTAPSVPPEAAPAVVLPAQAAASATPPRPAAARVHAPSALPKRPHASVVARPLVKDRLAAAAPVRPHSGKIVRRARRDSYSEVFRRCPAPGEAGAVECRRHICDGAEGKGPACRPYLRRRDQAARPL